jgi:hypothetical protein
MPKLIRLFLHHPNCETDEESAASERCIRQLMAELEELHHALCRRARKRSDAERRRRQAGKKRKDISKSHARPGDDDNDANAAPKQVIPRPPAKLIFSSDTMSHRIADQYKDVSKWSGAQFKAWYIRHSNPNAFLFSSVYFAIQPPGPFSGSTASPTRSMTSS